MDCWVHSAVISGVDGVHLAHGRTLIGLFRFKDYWGNSALIDGVDEARFACP